jgi:uncharacterized protein
MFQSAVLVLLSLLCLAGCASHSDHTLAIRNALDAGKPAQALELVNEQMEVDGAKELPAKTDGENALFLLDRAMILQQLARHELSSRDLEVADKEIDLLDLSRNAAHDIGKYLFSDDTGPYKAPAYEKLLINTMNMLNYLVRGDLNGARIEARRLSVMQSYFADHPDEGRALSGPGSYLAGFTFEKSGKPDEALLHYDEALAFGAFPSLAEPVKRLLDKGGRRSPRLTSIAERAKASAENADAEILVVLNFGRVPAKLAKRVPIGLALTYASGAISPADRDKANYLAAQGLVTWVNYPELGKPRGGYDTPGFALNGSWVELEGALAVDQAAKETWERAKGTVIAAAITRMLTRVVAGEAARQASKDGVVGALLSLGVQATLTATDTPDTRSWATLPARIAIGRVRVPAGTYNVELVARGQKVRKRVELKSGGWTVLSHTVLY